MVPSASKAPKYLDGREPLVNPRIHIIFLWVTLDEKKNKTWDLSGLISSPEALAKKCQTFLKGFGLLDSRVPH